MSLKYYGIYLAYAPTVDLRHEGLGRYLAAFLKGAALHSDIRFVLVCPSWSRESLEELFNAEAVPQSCFELISPEGVPPALQGYQKWQQFKKRECKPSLLNRLAKSLRAAKGSLIERTLHRVARAESIPTLILALLPTALQLLPVVLLSPVWLPLALLALAGVYVRRVCSRPLQKVERIARRLKRLIGQPKDDGLAVRMYQEMELSETRRMQVIIDRLRRVRAWYCPTAFWPAFNEIKAPRLTCVPDVVLTDFPVAFAKIGENRFLQNFTAVESAISNGNHYVTYSNSVKWETLIDRYAIRADRVAVVHHAPNDLSHWISIKGFDDPEAASVNHCHSLIGSALKRSSNKKYTNSFLNTCVKFFFYASQLRPNKNIITLLRAYEFLLRKRFIGHKLILTGNPEVLSTVTDFILDHNLQNDVLFLHGLKIQELAACYKLADLAVNPSLSEGGCPFTFTEALSVDTPVVMARIPVTEEVLADPQLQEMTFFDPYDWQDLASRIEWALANRDELLAVQRKAYVQLAQRTWADVVDEHLQVLERISEGFEEKARA
jgi:glycosyltransferase involved in cell wall biosynthesis